MARKAGPRSASKSVLPTTPRISYSRRIVGLKRCPCMARFSSFSEPVGLEDGAEGRAEIGLEERFADDAADIVLAQDRRVEAMSVHGAVFVLLRAGRSRGWRGRPGRDRPRRAFCRRRRGYRTRAGSSG